jgi:hypothetical protein
MEVGIRHADHVAPSIRKKLAITSSTRGGRSVGIIRSLTQIIEFFLILHTVGTTPWTGDQPVAKPVPTYTQEEANTG